MFRPHGFLVYSNTKSSLISFLMASFDSLLSTKPQNAGWFSTLYKNYRNRDSAASVLEKFAKLETDEDRFEYIR